MSREGEAVDLLVDLIADHPMWIGDDGQPLDYLPEREARIADFCHEYAAALRAAAGTPTHRGGMMSEAEAATCTVCGSRSLRRATWGKRCDLLQHDLSRCPGILLPVPAPDDAEGKG